MIKLWISISGLRLRLVHHWQRYQHKWLSMHCTCSCVWGWGGNAVQNTLHHLACRKSRGPRDEQWHETKQPLLLLSVREDSTKELCCNHFCLWHDYMYDGHREAVGVGVGGGGDAAFCVEWRHAAYLHTGSKCSHLTCWVMGIVNIIGRTHKVMGWSEAICLKGTTCKKKTCVDIHSAALLGFMSCFSAVGLLFSSCSSRSSCRLHPIHVAWIEILLTLEPFSRLTTAAVQLRLYHCERMQWINIGYLSAASLHLLHQLSLPSRSEETQVSQVLFPCAIRLWTYSYSIGCLKYLFLCMLRSFSRVTEPSRPPPQRNYRENLIVAAGSEAALAAASMCRVCATAVHICSVFPSFFKPVTFYLLHFYGFFLITHKRVQ